MATRDRDDRGAKESATEVVGLVRDYATQEVLEPLKATLGFVKWGLIGAVLVGIGLIELTVAVLRSVQAEGSNVVDGRLSFVPYVVTLVVVTVVLLVTKRLMTSRKPVT